MTAAAPRPAPRHRTRHDPGPTLLVAASLLAGVFVAMLAWATQARMAVTASATGKVVPPQGVQVLGHPEGGRVAALHVRIGDRVTAGQTLLELDPTVADADLAQLMGEDEALRAEIKRLEAEAGDRTPEFSDIQPGLGERQMALFQARLKRHQEEIQAAGSEIAAAAATASGTAAALVPLEKRRKVRGQLADQGLASRFLVDEDDARIAELTGRLNEARSNQERARRRLAAIREARTEEIAKSLNDARNRLTAVSSVMPKLEHRVSTLQITAPVNGTVKHMAAAGKGASLRPGEPAVEIVPDTAKGRINAKLPAAEIGHVHAGQEARITLLPPDSHLRPMDGTVLTVAPDSAADERTGQLSYVVEIEPAAEAFSDDKGEAYRLTAGVPVAVTILTGTRTVLGSVAGPLFADLDTALTER